MLLQSFALESVEIPAKAGNPRKMAGRRHCQGERGPVTDPERGAIPLSVISPPPRKELHNLSDDRQALKRAATALKTKSEEQTQDWIPATKLTEGYFWCRCGSDDSDPTIIEVTEPLVILEIGNPESQPLTDYPAPWEFKPVSLPD
jgi:hypothetical protein